jgi:hypothetical protein
MVVGCPQRLEGQYEVKSRCFHLPGKEARREWSWKGMASSALNCDAGKVWVSGWRRKERGLGQRATPVASFPWSTGRMPSVKNQKAVVEV